jgi:CHAT domain-containing protein
VTSDGTALAERVELDRATIRRYAEAVDPLKWGKRSGGLMGRKSPDDLPGRLAPLVGWFEDLWDEGLIREDDHLCYSADEDLHLIPLHLLNYRDKPLLHSLSVSRVHSARALLNLLAQAPLRPARFTAVQSSAQEDAADVVPGFAAVSRWLLQTLPGSIVAGEDANLDRIRSLDCRRRLVHFTTHGIFPAVGNTLLDPNPFRSSGVLLAGAGGLPSKNAAARGEASDCLLTPAAILELNFAGAHITLQACSSGLSREGAGGDALGMEYAALLAGAPSVLAAHWDVPLGPSSDFCTLFYRNWLTQDMSRAQAWRSAALELLASTASPHVWAAFSLTGDWR